MPFFSVIIPSRNRPALLSAAVVSVLAQDFDDYEIVIVDDGSQPALDLSQLQIDRAVAGRVRIVNLDYQPRGRGPAYARNIGVWASAGEYCAFLDDDDVWVKNDHLRVAYEGIRARESAVDLYLANQEAFDAATGETRRLWLYSLASRMAAAGRQTTAGSYLVAIEDLLATGGFGHLNTSIVRRAFFDGIAGLDEYLSYEEDLDFFLRAIDRAGQILYCPDVVARHNVPDRTRQANASTTVNYLQRLNIRLYLLNKNLHSARHAALGQYCSKYGASTLKHITQEHVRLGDFRAARQFATAALGASFSLKWFGYCLYLCGRSWFSGEQRRG